MATNRTAAEYRRMPLEELRELEAATARSVEYLEGRRMFREADVADEELRLITRIAREVERAL